jgi:PAS domain S-box-containing protein
MANNKNNSTAKVSRRSSKKAKPILNEEIASLIQAFEYFAETTEKLKESYDKLQEQISSLDLELERKNVELDNNLRKMDTIKNHLENILESMTLGVVVVDLAGNISVFNRAASEITGYKPRAVIGKPYEATIGRNIPPEYSPVYTLRTGIERRNKEKEISTKNGKTIPVSYSTSVVVSEQGELLGVVEIFSDLREIKKLQEEVQQSRTLSALGEMASNVAHELRNPLGGIGGFAALLERDLDINDPRRKLVQKIIEGIERLNRIATNLLVYTRPVRPNKRPENIVKIVNDVLMLVQIELEQYDSAVKIVKMYEIESKDVPIDPELFQQVFLNIVKNAVQAMSYEGVLTISLKDNSKKEQVEISIADTGIGIEEEDKKKLYMPFFTTKTDGTGLGLSIAKKIVDAHNGAITVESTKGTGTTFTVNFPY